MSALRLIHSEVNDFGVTRFYWGDDNGNITVQAQQDLQQFVDDNKRTQIDRGKKITSDVCNPIGQIPHIIGMKWLHEEGWWWQDCDRDPSIEKKLRAKLNDSDYRYLLRTSELVV